MRMCQYKIEAQLLETVVRREFNIETNPVKPGLGLRGFLISCPWPNQNHSITFEVGLLPERRIYTLLHAVCHKLLGNIEAPFRTIIEPSWDSSGSPQGVNANWDDLEKEKHQKAEQVTKLILENPANFAENILKTLGQSPEETVLMQYWKTNIQKLREALGDKTYPYVGNQAW